MPRSAYIMPKPGPTLRPRLCQTVRSVKIEDLPKSSFKPGRIPVCPGPVPGNAPCQPITSYGPRRPPAYLWQTRRSQAAIMTHQALQPRKPGFLIVK